ncbi:MAG: ribulose-phosphate 3-epimerase [Candidatus Omnitrophota bacterium]
MIIPAILTDDKDEFVKMLSVCKKFAPYLQIDVMDGQFVPSCSVDMKSLVGLKSPLGCEAHLMVNDPLPWIDVFKEFGAERIIFHYEIVFDRERVINRIRQKGLSAGLAVNPDSKIEDFRYLIDKIDLVLFMSVVPGFYGAKFIPSVLDKIKEFKRLYPAKKTAIDGGIKIDNVKEVFDIGIDHICVGSAVLKAVSPQDAYKQFLAAVEK